MRSVALWIACGPGAPEHPANITALEQGQVEREPGDTSREAYHAEPAFPGDRTQGRLGIVATNDIVDHIGAVRSASRLEGFCQCLRLILVEWRARVGYESVDVLQDMEIRQGIKAYSDWPTIPQLYIKGEFVGGSDIMMEMYEAGELQQLVAEAGVSPAP